VENHSAGLMMRTPASCGDDCIQSTTIRLYAN
jgi:hypothetical protein